MGKRVTVTIVSTKNNFGKVLVLVNEMLHKPGFAQKEFEELQQELLANIDQQKSDPWSIAWNTMSRILFPYPKGHIWYNMTFDEQTDAAQNVKLEDIKKFYADFYNGARATASVVGDDDENATVQQINSILKNWNSSKTYTRIKGKYFDVPASDQKINTPDKKNAIFYALENLQLMIPIRII